jgi:hypothetical protein
VITSRTKRRTKKSSSFTALLRLGSHTSRPLVAPDHAYIIIIRYETTWLVGSAQPAGREPNGYCIRSDRGRFIAADSVREKSVESVD